MEQFFFHIENTIKDFDLAIEKLPEIARTVKARIRVSRETFNSLKNEAAQLQNIKDVLTNDNRALELQIEGKKSKIQSLEKELEESLQKQKDEFFRIVENENKRLANENLEITEKRNKVSKDNADTVQMKAELQTLLDENKKAKEEFNNSIRTYEKLKEGVLETKRQYEDISAKKKECEHEVKINLEILAQIEKANEDNAKVVAWINEEKKTIDIKEKDIEAKISRLREDHNKLTKYKIKIEETGKVAEKKYQENVDKETALAKREKNLDDREFNLNNYKKELEAAASRIKGK